MGKQKEAGGKKKYGQSEYTTQAFLVTFFWLGFIPFLSLACFFVYYTLHLINLVDAPEQLTGAIKALLKST